MESSSSRESAATLAEVANGLNAVHPLGKSLPALFFFTDSGRTPDLGRAIDRLPPKCAVVFRHYDDPNRADLAMGTVERCHDQGRLCLIAGDDGLARKCNADGLHLPEYMASQMNLSDLPKSWLITASTHSAAGLQRAHQIGVDAAFLSPIFETPTHEGAPTLGVGIFCDLVCRSAVPVYALGGITEKTAPQLNASGAVGIAAIGGLLDEA